MPTENELAMLRAARAAGITTREEMANFMGQMGHESGGFARLEDIPAVSIRSRCSPLAAKAWRHWKPRGWQRWMAARRNWGG